MSTLDVCRKDFEKLIKKIEVEDSFEGDPHNQLVSNVLGMCIHRVKFSSPPVLHTSPPSIPPSIPPSLSPFLPLLSPHPPSLTPTFTFPPFIPLPLSPYSYIPASSLPPVPSSPLPHSLLYVLPLRIATHDYLWI